MSDEKVLTKVIRLMVIDDHDIVRSGVVRMIRGTEIQLIAESNSGENILEGIAQYQPDVILLDVRMESGDGLTVLGRAKAEYPQIPVLMFSAFDDPIYVARSVTLGASGYLSKTLDREQIIEAITGAYRDGSSWTSETEMGDDSKFAMSVKPSQFLLLFKAAGNGRGPQEGD